MVAAALGHLVPPALRSGFMMMAGTRKHKGSWRVSLVIFELLYWFVVLAHISQRDVQDLLQVGWHFHSVQFRGKGRPEP
jgi:hypothetical protein